MNYEIVTLPKQTVVGISARTNNTNPDMTTVIGNLWEDFFQKGIYENIQNKTSGKTMGIYTDYAGNEKDDYSIIVATPVSQVKDLLPNTIISAIPEGKYAKFILKGNMHKIVIDFWTKLWDMDLDRSFICDFEEYQNADMENAEVHVYISLK
ncbi:GyrI-like domain-containing protein [Fusobacterium sp. PH5-44]|uniref:GyrI-like domain-containing protein n=1 Tax=unclassified Fusobacterium TaxID=2648384 RepID=UPI003D21C99B